MEFWSKLAPPAKVILVLGLIQLVIAVGLVVFAAEEVGGAAKVAGVSLPDGMSVTEIVIALVVAALIWLGLWTFILDMIYKSNQTVAWVVMVIILVAPLGGLGVL